MYIMILAVYTIYLSVSCRRKRNVNSANSKVRTFLDVSTKQHMISSEATVIKILILTPTQHDLLQKFDMSVFSQDQYGLPTVRFKPVHNL